MNETTVSEVRKRKTVHTDTDNQKRKSLIIEDSNSENAIEKNTNKMADDHNKNTTTTENTSDSDSELQKNDNTTKNTSTIELKPPQTPTVKRRITMKQLKDENEGLKTKQQQLINEFKKQLEQQHMQQQQLQQQVQQQQQQMLQQQQQQQQMQQQMQQSQPQQAQQQPQTNISTQNQFSVLVENGEDNTTENMQTTEEEDTDKTPYTTMMRTLKRKNTNSPQKKQEQQQQQQQQQQQLEQQSKKQKTNNGNINNNSKPSTSAAAAAAARMTTKTTTTTTVNTNNNAKTNNKPPPLHVHNQTISETIQLLTGAQITEFKTERVNATKHTIICSNMETYNKAKEMLKLVSTPFFTYTPKDEKTKSIVLKGLHEEENPEDIKQHLIDQHGIEVRNVVQLKTKQSKQSNSKLPLYIVQCAATTNMGQLYNIKTINYQVVQWEQLKKQDGIIQCHQCQRFGHVAINCNLHYRCVKCSNKHEPGQCEIKDKVCNSEVYCTNCEKMGHPASYKGCPVYQATLDRLRKKIQERRNGGGQTRIPANIPITKNTYVNQNSGTFAEMLQGGRTTMQQQQQQQQQPQQQLPQQQQQQSAQFSMLAQNVQQLAEKVNTLAETTRQQGEQIATLMELIRQVV